MIILEPSVELETHTKDPLLTIEEAGRLCYKSDSSPSDETRERFIAKIIQLGHESVIEHASASVLILTDRGVTHELVRHRIASFSQESTRYCDYFGFGNMGFIAPYFVRELLDTNKVCNAWDGEYFNKMYHMRDEYPAAFAWIESCLCSERNYNTLRRKGLKKQDARSILNNSLVASIMMTANFREWRHFFKLRCSKKAHPHMQEIANMIFKIFKAHWPVIFEDLEGEI